MTPMVLRRSGNLFIFPAMDRLNLSSRCTFQPGLLLALLLRVRAR